MKQFEFHPLANEYPLMPAYDLGRLEQAMRDRGFDPRFPVILFEGKILDGRNRYLAAQAAGLKGLLVETFKGTAEEARQFVVTANEERRHLATEWLKKRREERIARVFAAREEGQSLRTIAEQEGVSESQVRQDLAKASGAQGCAPEMAKIPAQSEAASQKTSISEDADGSKSDEPESPKTVTGRDGKTYAATKPNKPAPMLCDRCARTGAVQNCERCKEHRKALRDAARAPQPGDADESEIKDAEGETVPEQARAAFVAAGTLTGLCRELDEILHRIEAVAKGPGGRLIRLDSVKQQLKDAKGNLWANRPTHVCPYCHGKMTPKPCECCKGEGWTAKHVWSSAPGNSEKAKRA